MSKLFYFKQFRMAKVHSLVLFDPKIRLSGATTPDRNRQE